MSYPPRNIGHCAMSVAAIVGRSNQTRGVLSEKTIKNVSRRKSLKLAFLNSLTAALADIYDITLIQLNDRGGFGFVLGSVVRGAKPVLAKRSFSAEELAIFQKPDFSKEDEDFLNSCAPDGEAYGDDNDDLEA